jgi:hypothetical protein
MIPHHRYTLKVASRALDSLHLALVTTMMYHYTVTNWGDATVLIRTTWYVAFEIFTQPRAEQMFQGVWRFKSLSRYAHATQTNLPAYAYFLCQTVLTLIVQCFFARRIWGRECCFPFASRMFGQL